MAAAVRAIVEPGHDWILHHANTTPDRLAQECLYSGRRFSYAEMNERVARLSWHLQESIGVSHGDRIASLCHNSTDCNELIFAAQRIGAVYVPLNWRLALRELEYMVADARPKVLVYSQDFAATATQLNIRCGMTSVISKGDGDDSDYERAIFGSRPRWTPVGVSDDDTWILMYTSGTTGRPRGVMLTHRAQRYSCLNATASAVLTHRSKWLVFLPQFHIGGTCAFALPVMHLGGSIVVMRNFDARRCLQLLTDKATGITHTLGVPTNFQLISQLPEFRDAKFGHLQNVIIGGAPSPMSLLELYAERGLLFQHAFGMTETCGVVIALDQDRALDRIGSVGKPSMYVQLRVVDRDFRDVAAGETGELCVRGPAVANRYWGNAEGGAGATVEGWLRTGDAARVDADGFYYIVDRWKDMYISGGENVYPAEVEQVIYELDGVAECAVVGIADERWGEVGRAFVVKVADSALCVRGVMDHCRRNLASFKVPKSVLFVDELPHNATGKVVKDALPRN